MIGNALRNMYAEHRPPQVLSGFCHEEEEIFDASRKRTRSGLKALPKFSLFCDLALSLSLFFDRESL